MNTLGYNKVYCQAATLFWYFVHGNNGKYKDAFISKVYLPGKSKAKEIEQALGIKIEDIEDDYIKYANTLYKIKIKK